jgi:hypothetical protein
MSKTSNIHTRASCFEAALTTLCIWLSSPLHLAAGGGHVDAVKALLFAKANIEAENGYNHDSMPASTPRSMKGTEFFVPTVCSQVA